MFSLGVLLLAVVAAATNGTCTCLDAYSSDVKKTGQTEDELETWVAVAKRKCAKPLIDECASDCRCCCSTDNISSTAVNKAGFPIVICTPDSVDNSEYRQVWRKLLDIS